MIHFERGAGDEMGMANGDAAGDRYPVYGEGHAQTPDSAEMRCCFGVPARGAGSVHSALEFMFPAL